MTATLTPEKVSPVSAEDQKHIDEYFLSVDGVEETRQFYIADPTNSPLGIKFWRACAYVISVIGSRAIPVELAASVGHVEALGRHLLELIKNEGADLMNYEPDAHFWRRWENVLSARRDADKFHDIPPVESIADLTEQKVEVDQISNMHGLTLVEVRREQDKPGSVCGPDYVAPAVPRSPQRP